MYVTTSTAQSTGVGSTSPVVCGNQTAGSTLTFLAGGAVSSRDDRGETVDVGRLEFEDERHGSARDSSELARGRPPQTLAHFKAT